MNARTTPIGIGEYRPIAYREIQNELIAEKLNTHEYYLINIKDITKKEKINISQPATIYKYIESLDLLVYSVNRFEDGKGEVSDLFLFSFASNTSMLIKKIAPFMSANMLWLKDIK